MICPLCFAVTFAAHAETTNTETIVFVRHGEKTKIEMGQLNCQGLNRSLKLPKMLVGKYGKPDFIFAPNPSKDIERFGKDHSYIRPLATIEPTAIQLGLPINVHYSYKDVAGISKEFLNTKYNKSLIFAAWEHNQLINIVRHIDSQLGGNSNDIPNWDATNFDSIYILKISTDSAGKKTVTFSQDTEGLNGQSETCPSA